MYIYTYVQTHTSAFQGRKPGSRGHDARLTAMKLKRRGTRVRERVSPRKGGNAKRSHDRNYGRTRRTLIVSTTLFAPHLLRTRTHGPRRHVHGRTSIRVTVYDTWHVKDTSAGTIHTLSRLIGKRALKLQRWRTRQENDVQRGVRDKKMNLRDRNSVG